jgi:peptidoglycan hydrolase-like protein with peptidoglycan-binding domain
MRLNRWTTIGGSLVIAAGLVAGLTPVAASAQVCTLITLPDGSLACAESTTTIEPPTTQPTTTVATTAPPTTSPTTTQPQGPPPAFGIVTQGRGSRGNQVKTLQHRLSALGFWVQSGDGVYGTTTIQAVMAFQKQMNLPVSGNVDRRTADVLNFPLPRVKSNNARSGNYFEIDKGRQIGYIVRDGQVLWALNVSTGSGKHYKEFSQKLKKTLEGDAITPEGTFKVYMERPVDWWEGELGRMYRPKYVYGGVAVHGASNVPNYPASHGCIRVSVAAMDWIYAANMIPKGSTVWIHK